MNSQNGTRRAPWRLESLVRAPLSVVLGVAFVGLCAQVEKDIGPVPLSLQTYAVLVVGAISRPKIAAATLAAYLLVGALGLPVFANRASGLEHLYGRTAGYLLGFLVSAVMTSYWVERWSNLAFWRLFWIVMAGHGVILVLGTLWLSTSIGLQAAIEFGFLPFLVGGLLKSLLAAVTVLGLFEILSEK